MGVTTMSRVEKEYAKLRAALPNGAMLSYMQDPKRGKIVFSEQEIPEDDWFVLPNGILLVKKNNQVYIYEPSDPRIQGIVTPPPPKRSSKPPPVPNRGSRDLTNVVQDQVYSHVGKQVGNMAKNEEFQSKMGAQVSVMAKDRTHQQTVGNLVAGSTDNIYLQTAGTHAWKAMQEEENQVIMEETAIKTSKMAW